MEEHECCKNPIDYDGELKMPYIQCMKEQHQPAMWQMSLVYCHPQLLLPRYSTCHLPVLSCMSLDMLAEHSDLVMLQDLLPICSSL